MEDKEIIETYLKKGKLLSKAALQAIKRGTAPSSTGNLVIAEKDFPGDNVRIIKCLESKKKELTTEDFIQFYTSKFQKMKSIILSRLQKDFVSLNKIGSDRREIYTIGIVREVKNKNGKTTIDLEDMTSTATVIFDEPPAVENDDVVALQAIAGGEVLFGKKAIFPDVPLRKPTTGEGKACFVSDLHLDEVPKNDAEDFFSWFGKQGAKYLFVSGGIGDFSTMEEMVSRYCLGRKVFVIPGDSDNDDEYPQLPTPIKGATCLSNPSMVEVNGVKVLMVHNLPDQSLQKRYLGKSKCVLPEDFLVMDEVPDIISCGHTQRPHVTNYKSITIVNSGSLLADFRPVIIDLGTRETVQEKVG